MGGRRAVRIAVLLGVLLLGNALTVGAQQKASAASEKVGKDGRRDLLKLVKLVDAYRALVYSPPQKCQDKDCNVTINVTVVPVNVGGQTQNICIARFPEELDFSNTGNGSLKITWSFDPGNMLINFHETNGILVVQDDAQKPQIDPDKHSIDATHYGATNKHDKKGSVTTYVPVILYSSASTVPPSVCATGDPKIVNN